MEEPDIYSALRTGPRPKRDAALVAFVEEGHTYKETGAKFGISLNRARQIHVKAKERRAAVERAARRAEREAFQFSLSGTLIAPEIVYVQKDKPKQWPAEEDAFLYFSVRTRNRLLTANIRSQQQLAEWDDARLLRLPGFGRKSLNEVRAIIPRP